MHNKNILLGNINRNFIYSVCASALSWLKYRSVAIAAAVLAPAFPYHPCVDALRRHFASAFGLKPSTRTQFPGAHSAFLVAKGWRDQKMLMHPGAR